MIEGLTIAKITSLAIVDSVNPCAIAVLTLMLISIMTYNPKNRKKVLLAGLAFVCAVFIGYLIYGLVLIKIFEFVQFITKIRLSLYKILGLIGLFLGVMNVKDFLAYKPGTLGTEMPLKLRPKVKKTITKITSPWGAFSIGMFVTIFLLPCTIGPYIIASGILSFIGILKSLPWLIYYNLIFVLPMIAITLLVYFGYTRVEKVSGWREKNIEYLHLIAGLIMIWLATVLFKESGIINIHTLILALIVAIIGWILVLIKRRGKRHKGKKTGVRVS